MDALVANRDEPVPAPAVRARCNPSQPTTELEKTVDDILRKGGLAEERGIAEMEALELKRLDPDEVRARQAQLVKMRNLLFHHELKAKRAAKIKSKACGSVRRSRASGGLDGPDSRAPLLPCGPSPRPLPRHVCYGPRVPTRARAQVPQGAQKGARETRAVRGRPHRGRPRNRPRRAGESRAGQGQGRARVRSLWRALSAEC